MKAVQQNEYGPISTLQQVEADKPGISENQVLIKIKASAVNPIDIKIRSGIMSQGMPKTFPLTLGWEASGIIEELGRDVKNFSKGDEVYTMPNFGQGGTYAEYVAVNENEVALKPTTLSHLQAAGVPMTSGAAYTSIIKCADIQPGQKILIHGAAGAVGSFAVQIAKSKGAYVIGTAAGPGIELLKSLNADEIINYTTTDFASTQHDLDVVLDLVGGETLMKSFQILKKGGLLLSTVMPPPEEKIKEMGIKGQMVFTQPDSAMLSEIAGLIDKGIVKVQEPTVFTLEQVQKAHESIENRTAKGKIVFEI